MVALGSPLATPTKRHATSLLLHQRTMLWRILPLKHVPMQCNGNKLCPCYLVYRWYRMLHMIPDIFAPFDFGRGSAFDLNSKSDQQSCSLGHMFLFRNYSRHKLSKKPSPANYSLTFFLLHPSTAPSASLPKDDRDHDPWLEF